MRDSQRSKVYRAEREARGATGQFRGANIPEVRDVQAYVDHLIASAWWTRRYPRVKAIRVDDGRGARRGYATHTSISLPRSTRFEQYILHEVTHVAVANEMRGQDYAHHGWQYGAAYLDLIRYKLGEDAFIAARESYRKHRVKYKAPRQLSPETLEAMRERGRMLAAAGALNRKEQNNG